MISGLVQGGAVNMEADYGKRASSVLKLRRMQSKIIFYKMNSFSYLAGGKYERGGTRESGITESAR